MNRWIRLIAAVVAMIQIANLQYGWTLFVQPLRDANGWSLSQVQWGLTIFIALETWAMPLCGFLIDKQGVRPWMTIGGILCAIGWGALGMTQSLTAMYFLYALAGFGAAIVYCGSIGVALKWFPDRRGFAAGIIAAGFGSGSALFVPALSYFLKTYGHTSTFMITGLIQGLLIIVAAQFLGGAGTALTQAPSTAPAAIRRQTQNFSSSEMLRSMQFYWLYAMMLMMGIGGLLATAQVAPVAKSFGIGGDIVKWSITINSIANGSGRFFWGWVSDRLGRERTMLIAFLIQSVALVSVMALGSTSPTLFVASMALVFFTWGEVYVLFPSALADFFGGKNASANYSFLYSTKGVASIIAGGLAAQLFESSGSWGPAFYGSAVLALISAGMALGLMKLPLPSKVEQPATEPLTVSQR
ncbi:MAG: oxalate/formate MFS antiporter [Bryobacteraceae bacterium]